MRKQARDGSRSPDKSPSKSASKMNDDEIKDPKMLEELKNRKLMAKVKQFEDERAVKTMRKKLIAAGIDPDDDPEEDFDLDNMIDSDDDALLPPKKRKALEQ